MLEMVAKFLYYSILLSGIMANILIDVHVFLVLLRNRPAYRHTPVTEPMLSFIILFVISVLVYLWLHD